MVIFETLTNLPDTAQGAVIAIGNFDGVHRGHRALLAQARRIADDRGLKLGVLTFEPHPRRLFRPDDPPFRLTPPALKARQLETCGIDLLFSLPFDWDFASQTAGDFIKRILSDGIRPAHIIVGADFRFGQLRAGTPQMLEAAGFSVTAINKTADTGGAIISSSAARQALAEGDIDRANNLLGWQWEMEGVVIKGDQRGRELGYPTANVRLGEILHPAYGVYATWVKIVEDGTDAPWRKAATNIGIRPMFEIPVGQIEAHILDFNRDIYGKTLRVRPVKRLRGEARFESLDALIAQIDKDCAAVRALLDSF